MTNVEILKNYCERQYETSYFLNRLDDGDYKYLANCENNEQDIVDGMGSYIDRLWSEYVRACFLEEVECEPGDDFPATLSEMEYQINEIKELAPMYKGYGTRSWYNSLYGL